MRCLFIFGAGASREAGGPLMADFLDKADLLRRTKHEGVREALESFESVFTAISELHGVHAKSYLDLDNIEVLFGAVEMSLLLNKFAGRHPEGIKKLRDDLVTVIYKTLETCIPFPVRDGAYAAPEPYAQLHRLITQQGGLQRRDPVEPSFITFNYDLALDVALGRFQYDYGLADKMPAGSVPLLKLHGSINWGLCERCGQIGTYPVREARFDLDNKTGVLFALGSHLNSRYCDCRLGKLVGPPVVVPPTWNKTAYSAQLGRVWRHAARVLSQAENIFVVGYSLPETDAFFRYLYALGAEGPARIKRFWVIDPDPSGEVEKRFGALVGGGLRNRFKVIRKDFSQGLQDIYDAMNAG